MIVCARARAYACCLSQARVLRQTRSCAWAQKKFRTLFARNFMLSSKMSYVCRLLVVLKVFLGALFFSSRILRKITRHRFHRETSEWITRRYRKRATEDVGEKIEGKITTAYRGVVKGFADCETLNVITKWPAE